MNVTFIIGNGFDLRLGLRTRYTDMYAGYVNEKNNNSAIIGFKNALKNDMPRFETWGDFEIAMGNYAESFKNTNDFVACSRDFRSYMVRHLKAEQDIFLEVYNGLNEKKKHLLDEFGLSLDEFYKAHTPNVDRAIEYLRNTRGKRLNFNFISFNYTTILDCILSDFISTLSESIKPYYNDVIHIHGELDKDIVLGVDNETQIKNKHFDINRQIQRAFIKPKFNEMFDSNRIDHAFRVIDNCDVICIYGLSMGDSDMMWNNKIVSWLMSDENRHLFYFSYGTNVYNSWDQDRKLDEEDEIKTQLLNRICLTEQDFNAIYDRVHIPIGKDIFNIQKYVDALKVKHLLKKLPEKLETA